MNDSIVFLFQRDYLFENIFNTYFIIDNFLII